MGDWPLSVIGSTELIYRYTVVGSDKASIDTGVDASDAGTNNWADGDFLEVQIVAKVDEVAVFGDVNVILNNDTGAVYDRMFIQGANATATANNNRGDTKWELLSAGASLGAAVFASIKLEFANYTGAIANKQGRGSIEIADATATNCVVVTYGLAYRPASPAPITRLKILPATAAKKFKVGTQMAIHKRKAS